MKKRRYTSKFKAKIALEAIKGLEPITEIANQFKVHPNQISRWKKEMLDKLPHIFNSNKEKSLKKIVEEKDKLYNKIGKLQVELEWLKKKSGVLN